MLEALAVEWALDIEESMQTTFVRTTSVFVFNFQQESRRTGARTRAAVVASRVVSSNKLQKLVARPVSGREQC